MLSEQKGTIAELPSAAQAILFEDIEAAPAIARSAAPRLVRTQGRADQLCAEDEIVISSEKRTMFILFITDGNYLRTLLGVNELRAG